MHRIDTVGSDSGRFLDGDAQWPESKPGTVIDAAWLNGVQESICQFIEQNGVPITKGDCGTLSLAINAVVAKSLTKVTADLQTLRNDLEKLREAIGKNE